MKKLTFTFFLVFLSLISFAQPEKPQFLLASPEGEKGIYVSYFGNDNETVTYVIECNEDGGNFYQFKKTNKSGWTVNNKMTPGVEYVFRVKAISDDGESEYLYALPVTVGESIDTPPYGAEKEALSESEISIVCNSVEGATSYIAILKTEEQVDGRSVTTSKFMFESETTEIIADNLIDGTKYRIFVCARDEKAISKSISAGSQYTKLILPELQSVELIDGQSVRLEWTDLSATSETYHILRKEEGQNIYETIADLDKPANEYTDTIESGKTYFYSITSSAYGVRNYPKQEFKITSSPALNIPENLNGQLSEDSLSIILSWENIDPNASSIVIERGVGAYGFLPNTYDEIATIDASENQYVDFAYREDRQNVYRIKVFDGEDYSEYSERAFVAAWHKPPTEFKVDSTSTTNIYFSWKDNSDEDGRYDIYFRTLGSDRFVLAGTVDEDAESFVVDDAEEGATYFFKLVYQPEFGDALESKLVEVTTKHEVPFNLQISTNEDGSYKLTWESNSQSELAYVVERSENGGDFQAIAEVDDQSNSFADNTATEYLLEYTYKVRIKTDESGESYTNQVRVSKEMPVPTIGNLEIAENTAVLDWEVISGIEKVSVYVSIDNEDAFELIETAENSGSYNYNLENGKKYYFKIKYHIGESVSDFSEVKSVTLTGVNDDFQSEIKLFPNPTTEFVSLQGIDFDLIEKISIVNIKGVKVKEITSSYQERINVQNLANGSYFMVVKFKDKTVNMSFVKM